MDAAVEEQNTLHCAIHVVGDEDINPAETRDLEIGLDCHHHQLQQQQQEEVKEQPVCGICPAVTSTRAVINLECACEINACGTHECAAIRFLQNESRCSLHYTDSIVSSDVH
ncbi:unnamed protein product [Calypogeia fissa]